MRLWQVASHFLWGKKGKNNFWSVKKKLSLVTSDSNKSSETAMGTVKRTTRAERAWLESKLMPVDISWPGRVAELRFWQGESQIFLGPAVQQNKILARGDPRLYTTSELEAAEWGLLGLGTPNTLYHPGPDEIAEWSFGKGWTLYTSGELEAGRLSMIGLRG